MLPAEIEKFTVNLLCDLISIQTINPPGLGYTQCAELLKEKLDQIGFHVELIPIPDEFLDKQYPYAPTHRGHPRHIVFGRKGSGSPTLHFNGHYDVVPAGTGWTTDPFAPQIKEGRIYGRGSSDMKGGIAATVGAMKHVTSTNLKFKGTVEVAFVPDEEAGGAGTKYLVESGRARPDYVIVAEPTHPPVHCIKIGHKGIVRATVRVLGKQVHGSRPWLGENAFVKASQLVTEFTKDYLPLLQSKATNHSVESIQEKNPTVNLGGCAESLSNKDNIVCGEFKFSVDRRVIPEETIDEVVKELREYFERAAKRAKVRHAIRITNTVPASVTPTDSKLVKMASKCVKSKFKIDPVTYLDAGRNDSIFYKQVGADVIAYGPGVQETAHMPDEYTTTAELTDTIEVYTDIMKFLQTTDSPQA